MQEPAAASTSPAASSFASLLAALAAPSPNPVPAWNEDGLDDDIATLSYEQALRTHARYRSADGGDPALQRAGASAQTRGAKAGSASRAIDLTAVAPRLAENRSAEVEPGTSSNRPAALKKNRKSASITIRLNKEECAQLHERAEEAGLTVSAYLRSCAFEVEALRTQVKEALAQFRSAPMTGEQRSCKTGTSVTPTWRTRLFPRWSSSRRSAHA
jgi:hypothetical protein